MSRHVSGLIALGAVWLSSVQSGLPQGTIVCLQPASPILLFSRGFAQFYPLDFDADGNPELTFAYYFQGVLVSSEGANRILIRASPPPNVGGPVAPLPGGFSIGPSSEAGGLRWYAGLGADEFQELIECFDVGCEGDFRGQHAYMGVEFQHAGSTNYGWVLLRIAPDYPTGQIEAWAWETRPGQSIVAGAGLDSDHDGVWDYLDQCPNTPPGAAVDTNGCSICQLCPCNGPWKNHGEYVKSVQSVASRFVQEGRVTEQQRAAIVKQAANSDCGKHR